MISYLEQSFHHQLNQLNDQQIIENIHSTSSHQVQLILRQKRIQWQHLPALLSEAAEPFIEQMAQRASQLTRERFGRTLGFFAPLYLSNLCANECSYCGFSMSNKIKRKTLSVEEVITECKALKRRGFDSILLVTGEHERKVGMDYFAQVIPTIKQYFSYIMLEVQPLSNAHYRQLKQLGVDSVLVYQESYHQQDYQAHHTRGNKSDFRWRLETPDRIGLAKMDKIGLGCLLGLSEWRLDCIKLASHLAYLQKHYWQSRYSVAFPRLRPCMGGITPEHLPNDTQLVQLITAFRLCNPQLDIVLSTRESPKLRDNLLTLGVTQISAGSSTQPGGYSEKQTELEQFEIDDNRSPTHMANVVKQAGLEVVWKDWEKCYSN